MKAGKNNFAQVIDYLRTKGLIHNQKDLADQIGSTPTTISRNKHGIVGRLDEETITKFNFVFGHVINIGFLRGESDVMLITDLHQQEKNDTEVNKNNLTDSAYHSEWASSSPDMSSLINAALAAKDETIAALRDQLADKERFILSLQQQIRETRAGFPQKEIPHGHHYSMVAAEDNEPCMDP